MSVARRLGRGRRADDGARAGPVVDDHRLLPAIGQPLRHDARQDVSHPAGGIRHDDLHRLGRKVLHRLRLRREGAEKGGETEA
ncbi:hypothetical protein D3C71_1627250 [compost metagenome]